MLSVTLRNTDVFVDLFLAQYGHYQHLDGRRPDPLPCACDRYAANELGEEDHDIGLLRRKIAVSFLS